MTQSFIPTSVILAATKAVYELQYDTNTAAKFICSEVRGTPRELAVNAVNRVAKVTR